MTLAENLLNQLDNPALNHEERSQLRCQAAAELEDRGQYEGASEALDGLWMGIGERPSLDGLSPHAAAAVLLRAGTLTGWLGSVRQIAGAQEAAKDLISESITRYLSLGENTRAAIAQSEMGFCYRRTGALDEARVICRDALANIPDSETFQKARAFLRLSEIEYQSGRNNDALRILMENSALFAASEDDALMGRFHNELARVYRSLATAERRQDYFDRAIIEYTAASFHFEQAGHTSYRARSENNLGFLFYKQGRYVEANEHLEYARRLFRTLGQEGLVASVDESRSRVYIAQGNYEVADKLISSAVTVLERSEDQGIYAEALTTQGIAKARLGERFQSQAILRRAMEVAEHAGSLEEAGLAAVVLLEEHAGQLTASQMVATYSRADDYLSHSQDAEKTSRLRALAARIMSLYASPTQASDETPAFVYSEESTAALLRHAQKFASTSLPLLIIGETGTGKNLLARLIHQWSGRAGKFVTVNCGALEEAQADLTLFGQVSDDSTSGQNDRLGMIREAEGGTLLLDEVGSLDVATQVKIMRLIEYREIQPIGATLPVPVNVRVLVTSRRKLASLARTGGFRPDLVYRLNAFEIRIPPLRERREDIIALAQYLVTQATARYGKRVRFTVESLELLKAKPLRGNAREIQNAIERAIIVADEGDIISAKSFEHFINRHTETKSLNDLWKDFSLPEEVNAYEAKFILSALEDTEGSISRAARMLGLKHQSLAHMLATRHRDLEHARKPAKSRRRSIIPR